MKVPGRSPWGTLLNAFLGEQKAAKGRAMMSAAILLVGLGDLVT